MHSTSCRHKIMVNDSLPHNEHGYGVNGWNPNTCSSLAVGESPSPVVSAGKSTAEMKEGVDFYEKLNRLNESAGLCVLFNVRDTPLDLQELYKNVTQRGGYHEVTKDGKWEEVASSVSPRNRLTPAQLEKLYATILYMFEQRYHYRSSKKPNKIPKRPHIPLGVPDLNSFMGKRKHDDRFYMITQQHFNDARTPSKHIHGFRKSSPAGNGLYRAVCMVEKKRRVLETTLDGVKETWKDVPCVPLGSRNCYQMFIKMETDRLKSIYGSRAPLRGMRETWKHLSNNDKLPYIEASKKDNERFVREMGAYEEYKRKQRNELQKTTNNAVKFSRPNLVELRTHSTEAAVGSHMNSCQDARKQRFIDSVQFEGDYHVALQPDDDHESALLSNDTKVQMVVGLMKNARPYDPIFQIDWDGCDGLIDIYPR